MILRPYKLLVIAKVQDGDTPVNVDPCAVQGLNIGWSPNRTFDGRTSYHTTAVGEYLVDIWFAEICQMTLCMFLEVNPCFQKAHVFCMDLQPAADTMLYVQRKQRFLSLSRMRVFIFWPHKLECTCENVKCTCGKAIKKRLRSSINSALDIFIIDWAVSS